MKIRCQEKFSIRFRFFKISNKNERFIDKNESACYTDYKNATERE